MNTREVNQTQTFPQLSFLSSGMLIALGALSAVVSFLSSVEIVGILAWLFILASAAQLICVYQLRRVGHIAAWQVLVAGIYLGAGLRLQSTPAPDLTGLIVLLMLLVVVDSLVTAHSHLAAHGSRISFMVWCAFITTTALIAWKNQSVPSVWRPGMLAGICMAIPGMTRLLLARSLRKYAKKEVSLLTGNRVA
jgi:hypothetical protein